jgi:hypothetical protein
METKTTEVKPNKTSRGGWWVTIVVAGVVAALVFGGGVVAAGRLSAPSREGRGEGPFGQRPNFQIEAAKELPTTTPTLRGLVTKRADNTLTIGQRNGGPGSNAQRNTQLLDVLIAGDTVFYHDVTPLNLNGQPPRGPIQQKVEPGSLNGINTNSRVTVWGDQTGNQITADVLVYSDPQSFQP